MNTQFKKRDIPWSRVVAFHKEIALRNEESFFALPLGKQPSNRWSSINGFEPIDFGGDWKFNINDLLIDSFRNLIYGGGLNEIFIGGPCWVRFKKEENDWKQQWCPFFYRSVRIDRREDGVIHIVPEQGEWEISSMALGILEQKGFLPRKPFEKLIPEILETTTSISTAKNLPLTSCLVETICAELPDFNALFDKEVNFASASHIPTRWIIFSPPPTGPLTQHLIRDYERLLELVSDDKNSIGGLRLFEGFPANEHTLHKEPTPIVPLNDSQRTAVRGILESKPITVISGPPGCGKSQVVLSLMLNAWQRGISVLFASNNNQAVDVVRARLERFEGHFPIAVRAGSKKKSNLMQALLDTLNFITGRRGAIFTNEDDANIRRNELLLKLEKLNKFFASKIPQRVDEAVRSSLDAYGTFQQTLYEIRSAEEKLLSQFKTFAVEATPESFFNEVVIPIELWLTKIPKYEKLINQDGDTQKRIDAEIKLAIDNRNRAVQQMGLDSSSVKSWSWLLSGPGPELLNSWFCRLTDLLAKPIEKDLAPYDWTNDFQRWQSEDEAKNWTSSSRDLSLTIRRSRAKLTPKVANIETVRNRYNAQASRIQQFGITPEIAVDPAILSNWSAAYLLEKSLQPSLFDWIPWSQRSRSIRQMKRAEKVLRSLFPLTIWRSVGELNNDGRDKLSHIVEETQLFLAIRSEWVDSQSLRDQIDATFDDIRVKCAKLFLQDQVQEISTLEKLQEIDQRLIETAILAEKAAIAWRKRFLAEKVTDDLRIISIDFFALASGVPIKEAWIQNQGRSFCEIIKRLGAEPSPQSVVETRTALYADTLRSLIKSWERAREAEILIRQLQTDLENIPTPQSRCDTWKTESPPNLPMDLDLPLDHLPRKNHSIFQISAKYREWISQWKHYCEHTQPELQKRSHDEYIWAKSKLQDATEILPTGSEKSEIKEFLQNISEPISEDWPTNEIQQHFDSYSPNRIKANIDGLEAQLEKLSFDIAKEEWLKRMTVDIGIQKALDDLHLHYRRNNERIDPPAFDSFKKALEAIPIWITVAQSPQSIPLLPDLFDILVIDEATQCTITNILPLIYRAKRLVVIGDKEQLPAIPIISSAVESALIAKFKIEENLMDVIGHADNDLYNAAVRCLPAGRHDVIPLEDHYRSHPLIIGFSNQYIYRTVLKIRTDPANIMGLPFGSIIHGYHVSGHCVRGNYDSSWKNIEEIEEVCKIVTSLRQANEGMHHSLGIVTPFRAQMDAINDRLRQLNYLNNVTVGTAYSFQGDERDIIIFSPVVSKGISDGTARWVENPHNLINVAVTRARMALYVVADFDYCSMQPGILGKLIKYVKTIDNLRDTSKEELELFSWMIAQGWEPLVHHIERDIEIDFVLTHEGKRLAIEVDGSSHENTTQQDKARDTFLRGMGYDVIRVPGRAVRQTPSIVIKQIGEQIGLPV